MIPSKYRPLKCCAYTEYKSYTGSLQYTITQLSSQRQLNQKEKTAMAAQVSCASCSSVEETVAKKFELNEKNVIEYSKDVEESWRREGSLLPDLETEVVWTVYRISPSHMFSHHSLLFVCGEAPPDNGSPGFTFELTYGDRGSGCEIFPRTAIMSFKEGVKMLGGVRGSAHDIMVAGLNCLAKFGNYHKVTHNCQDFCSDFAKALDLKVPWTDLQTVTVRGVSLVGILALLYMLWPKKKKD